MYQAIQLCTHRYIGILPFVSKPIGCANTPLLVAYLNETMCVRSIE